MSFNGQISCISGHQDTNTKLEELINHDPEDRRNNHPLIADTKCLLVTHPRCCGTAIELFLESCSFPIQCNVFDRDYYGIEHKGEAPPSEMPPVTDSDRFEAVVGSISQKPGPLLVRAAGYTIRPHIGSPELKLFLQTMDRCVILVRDPAYALPSHRRILERQGQLLSEEEAGYIAQLDLVLWMDSVNLPYRIVDAHRVLSDPFTELSFLGLPKSSTCPKWNAGLRERWGLWPEWKREVANSTFLLPFTPNAEREEEGRSDPLYPSCNKAYQMMIARCERSHA